MSDVCGPPQEICRLKVSKRIVQLKIRLPEARRISAGQLLCWQDVVVHLTLVSSRYIYELIN